MYSLCSHSIVFGARVVRTPFGELDNITGGDLHNTAARIAVDSDDAELLEARLPCNDSNETLRSLGDVGLTVTAKLSGPDGRADRRSTVGGIGGPARLAAKLFRA